MLAYITTVDLQKILQVKELLEKNYKYNFTHCQLASKVGTNEFKLRTIFKQFINMTINEYVTVIRIEKAKELLETTDLPIKMVAEKVGYDIRNFNRQFKKNTKTAPLIWRRSYGKVYLSLEK